MTTSIKSRLSKYPMSESHVYRFALLGEGVNYSRSPDIFKAIFDIEGIDGEFRTVNCSQDELEACLKTLADGSCDALSVTIPHKEAILPYLDEIDKIAMAIGSVNSICFHKGKSHGYNTDTFGFSQQLVGLEAKLKGSSALILGAGGAARSAAFSLALDYEVQMISILGRNPERLESTVKRLRQALPKTNIHDFIWSAADSRLPEESIKGIDTQALSIMVNATPLGGPNQPLALSDDFFTAFSRKLIYYDLNYNADNAIILSAKGAGLKTFDGLSMLVHQALRSYSLWTGRDISAKETLERIGQSGG